MTDHPPAGHQETDDSWRRPPRHGSTGRARAAERNAARPAPGDGKQGQAAAGPAVGALGRARPGASGSRCETKPARHDLSRRAATPDRWGAAVTAAASRAPWASRATIRQVSVTAASAISPAGLPSGRNATPCQVAWPVRADRTPPSIAITWTSALRPRYQDGPRPVHPSLRLATSWPECVAQPGSAFTPGLCALCVRRVTLNRQNRRLAPVAQLDRAAAF